jgi:hypothetical protein
VVGIVPIIGDALDVWFKSNLKNLDILEKWLLDEQSQGSRYHILLMPDIPEFIPPLNKVKSERKRWFGGGISEEEILARTTEVKTGKVRKTRRMGREECIPVGAGGEVPVRNDPVMESVD